MERLLAKLWNMLEKIVFFFFDRLCHIMKKDTSEHTFSALMQFVKFGIVGLSNSIVFYGVYAFCMYILRKCALFVQIDYYIAQIAAFFLSVLWSFYWNNRIVFKTEQGEKRSLGKALLKTYITYSFTGLFLNTILLALWVDVIGISEFVAPVINIIINVPLNFVINKFWAFRAEKI